MAAYSMKAVHVYWSRGDREYRRIIYCPTCKTRRRFYVWAQDWYDPIATCCTCGDRWSAGERMTRPFARGWREESAKKARAAYAAVVKPTEKET